MAVLPLLLLSSQDITEVPIIGGEGEREDLVGREGEEERGGYLLDCVDGGTGVCEDIFYRFDLYLQKCTSIGSWCVTCKNKGMKVVLILLHYKYY